MGACGVIFQDPRHTISFKNMSKLRNAVILVRDLAKGTKFYQEALGLRVKYQTESFAEIDTGSMPLVLKLADGEAMTSTGYSPILSFDVQNMEETVNRLIQQGAHMDGPIKYPAHGKFAAVRSPDGQMIGLFEPAIEDPESATS